jgi:hypothetical protein
METNALPVYEVEFLPVERRLSERRKSASDARAVNAPERRMQDRRQPPQALRAVQ